MLFLALNQMLPMKPDMSLVTSRAFGSRPQGPRIASQPRLNELAIEILATHDTFDTTATRWEPLVYWRIKPYQGEFVHIDHGGIRATWSPTPVRGNAPVRHATRRMKKGRLAW